MTPEVLIAIARLLAKVGTLDMPLQDELRKALSSAYYALFHALCNCVADQWIGAHMELRGSDAWIQAYRILEHGKTKAACIKACRSMMFSKDLIFVAEIFLDLLRARHRADYDPGSYFSLTETIVFINAAEEAIQKLMNVDQKERIAFLAYLAFPHRKD